MIARTFVAGTTIGLASLLASLPAPSAAEDAPRYTPAQMALFESNHMKNISRPVRLEYSFTHQGGVSGDFVDKVTADIRDVHVDGKKDVWVHFLSGPHEVDFPPAIGYRGNPLLMYFLEHDVTEMHEATGGAAAYFRNRIRESFLRADIRPTEVTAKGQTCDGHEITVSPFRTDPNLTRFPAIQEKTYRFVLCDTVPGTIYEISTVVPEVSSGPGGAFKEAMTYENEQTP